MSFNLQERSFPYNLVRKLKVENEDIEIIKQSILKSENTLKNSFIRIGKNYIIILINKVIFVIYFKILL